MKKITAILLLIIITLSLFAGCGRETGTETSAVPTETEVPAETLSPLPEVDADPLIWQVTDKDGHTLYLFGTMHAGDERSDGVLKDVDKILSSCDSLAVEFDTEEYQRHISDMMTDMKKFVYTDGTKITDHLSEDLYNKMKDVLTEANLYSSMYDMYRPCMWSQLLESAYLEKTSLSTDYAIDVMLIGRAKSLGKPVLDIESGSFQMSLLASFPDELNILMIESTLDYSYEEYADGLAELYDAWLSGDEAKIEELSNETDDELTEEEQKLLDDYNYKMLDERNLGMADKAREYLKGGDTVFFAVGAAHTVGDAGIVSLLEKDGYTVRKISTEG